MAEFDAFASEYRELHNRNIQATGADSAYFCAFKAGEIARIERNPRRLLDFGCGDGLVSQHFSHLLPQTEIHGIDVSEDSVQVAAGRGIARATFTAYDGRTIPYADKTFDVVFVAGVFHHVPCASWPRLFAELFRVTEPGGRLYLFEHNPYNPVTRRIVDACVFDANAVLVPSAALKAGCRATGFTEATARYVLFFPRHAWFKPFFRLEPLLAWLPLGAQYWIRAVKPI